MKSHSFHAMVAFAFLASNFQSASSASLTLLPEWFNAPTVRRIFMLPDGKTFTGVDGTDVFRWSATEGRTNLGTVPSTYGAFNHTVNLDEVSGDGGTLIGTVGSFGCMWTAATGLIFMPDSQDGFIRFAVPTAVSNDGNVIVGNARRFPNGLFGEQQQIAFRWTSSTGTESLGFAGFPEDVTPDGATVVGSRPATDVTGEAFRWTEQSGVEGLGFLPNSWLSSDAKFVSDDGSVVIGESATSNGRHLIRWTEQDGMQQISTLGEYQNPNDISAAATVVIGSLTHFDYERGSIGPWIPFLWSANNGLSTLSEVLAMHGLDDEYPLYDSNKSHSINAISADGHVIFGTSTLAVGGGTFTDPRPTYYYEQWLLDLSAIPEPSTFILAASLLLMAPRRRPRDCCGEA